MLLHSTCHHTSPVSSGVSCDLFTTFSKYACFWTVEGRYKDPDAARAEHVNFPKSPSLPCCGVTVIISAPLFHSQHGPVNHSRKKKIKSLTWGGPLLFVHIADNQANNLF